MVSVAAYAYEYLNDPIMSDAKFDRMCQRIDVERSTGNKKMDRWFRENFDPSTGIWVHEHPNIAALANLAAFILNKRRRAK